MIKRNFIFLTAIILSSCTPEQSTVNFSVVGSDEPLEIFVQRPYGRVAPGYSLFTDTLTLDGKGTVSMQVPVEGISSFMVKHNNTFEWMLLEPGKIYNMVFDYSNSEGGSLTVDDEALQVYRELGKTRNIYKYEWIRDYTEAPVDTNAVKMLKNFEQLIEKDKALYANVKMSGKMREAVYDEIELYWAATMAKIFGRNWLRQEREGIPMYGGYAETWDMLLEKYPISYNYAPFPWLPAYVKEYVLSKTDLSIDNIDYSQYMQNTYTIYENIKDKKAREVVTAETLIHDFVNNATHNATIIPYAEKFLTEYPASPFKGIISDFTEELNEFHRIVASRENSPDIQFVEDYDKIKTLKEAFAIFKGKPVFVDFWFTSCGPCHRQFVYNAPLKQFLKENDIEMLYISIDNPDLENDWKNAIKYYDLTGWHIRADHQLHVDMDKNYGIIYFPTYMFIDANGSIAINRAKEPEKGDELFEEIRAALKLSK